MRKLDETDIAILACISGIDNGKETRRDSPGWIGSVWSGFYRRLDAASDS